MSSPQVGIILRHLRKLATPRPDEGVPDHQLLESFVARQDEAAFAALVGRHGPMVLGVCRSVLHHEQDAEDAFQAVFLTLAKKAGSIHRRESVGSWLYRVAYHLSQKARVSAARRRAREQRAEVMPSPDPLLDMSLRELRGVLFEELERLPEKYRAPLVLCYLEEKTQEDAARLLGWTKGAVKGCLERGRRRLRAQLVRRGLAVPAGLSALVLAQGFASAKVPGALVDALLRAAPLIAAGQEVGNGLISAGAATLLKGVTESMFLGKLKIATLVLLVLGTLAAGVGLHQTRDAKAGTPQAGSDQPKAAKTDPQPPPKDAQPASGDAAETVTVRGRVLGPDGQSFAGAQLYLGRAFYNTLLIPSATSTDAKPPARATTGPDGRFRFTFSKKEIDPKQLYDPFAIDVVALAPEYAADWDWVKDSSTELTLRLVKEVPLRGRILDQDGRPVAAARIRVRSIMRYPAAALTRYLAYVREGVNESRERFEGVKGWPRSLPNQPETLTTGRDGRFRVTGLGPDDIVRFGLEGPGIQYVEYNQATTRPSPTVSWRTRDRILKIYGNGFDYVAGPARAVRGTVRDQETGKPIAGARVSSWQTSHQTQTDQDGRYELLGCPKGERYEVTVRPPEGSLYFAAAGHFTDESGLTPLTGDVALVRGIPCRGRLVDKRTGQPIAGAKVEYNALFPNASINKLSPNVANPCSATTTGKDGSYVLAVLPGPGAIGFSAYRAKNPYMPAAVDLKALAALWNDGQDHGNEMGLSTAYGPDVRGIMGVNSYNALYLLNPPEKATGVTQDAIVESGRTLAGRVVGPDGEPIKGVLVYGLQESPFADQTLAGDAFTVRDLNPRRTRALLFYHQAKQLGCYQEIRGDQKEPLVVKLGPCASATGRLVDADGQPIADTVVQFYRTLLLGPGGPRARTGPDGRFRVDGLVPGQAYDARPVTNPATSGPYFSAFKVKPGEVKDLGTAKVQPGN
jgi:RNA polymerase sigma factor (sigma-70 family)